MKRVAAIDIGSNSILLTIAEEGSPLKLLVDEAHVTGLSKGLSKDGLIQSDRLEKSLTVLKRYKELLDRYQITTARVAATEAMRKAKNGPDVKKTIEQTLGLHVDLISGEREAELSFWSVQKDFADRKMKKVVFDIGGASTELAYGAEQGIEKRVSLKVGSVLLTEKFGLKNKSNPSEALNYVHSLLKNLGWNLPPATGFGVAGTVTTLLAMEKGITDYERTKVHGMKISRDRVAHWMNEILCRNSEDRSDIPGLPQDRADVLGGGLAVAVSLMNFFEWNEVICMDSGVRFGLIYELMEWGQTD